MEETFYEHLRREIAGVREAGLYKRERVITSPQGAAIRVAPGGGEGAGAGAGAAAAGPPGAPEREFLNFCANNYLGLANHPRLREAARRALDEHGFGMSSVRFICGTQDAHKELERRL